jgi:hypothetical protein
MRSSPKIHAAHPDHDLGPWEFFGVFWGAKKRGADPKKLRTTPGTSSRSENAKLIFGKRDQVLIIELALSRAASGVRRPVSKAF